MPTLAASHFYERLQRIAAKWRVVAGSPPVGGGVVFPCSHLSLRTCFYQLDGL